MEDISIRFKKIRKALNKSQIDISKDFGITQQAISNIESGNSFLSKEILTKLTLLYNISLDWLITGSGSMFKEGKQLDIQKEVMKDSKIKELMKKNEELKKSVAENENKLKSLKEENAALLRDNREKLKEVIKIQQEQLDKLNLNHT